MISLLGLDNTDQICIFSYINFHSLRHSVKMTLPCKNLHKMRKIQVNDMWYSYVDKSKNMVKFHSKYFFGIKMDIYLIHLATVSLNCIFHQTCSTCTSSWFKFKTIDVITYYSEIVEYLLKNCLLFSSI